VTRVAGLSSELEIWHYESDDTSAPPAVVSVRSPETPALVWRLPIDQSPPVRRVYLLGNLLAWLALAGLYGAWFQGTTGATGWRVAESCFPPAPSVASGSP